MKGCWIADLEARAIYDDATSLGTITYIVSKKRLRRQVRSTLIEPGLPMRSPEETRRDKHCECESIFPSSSQHSGHTTRHDCLYRPLNGLVHTLQSSNVGWAQPAKL